MPRTLHFFNSAILAAILVGQIGVYCVAWRKLDRRPGRFWVKPLLAALAVFLTTTLAVVWLDNVGIRWASRSTAVSRALSFGAGIWTAGSAGAALVLLVAALLRRKFTPRGNPGPQRELNPEATSRRNFLWDAVAATGALAPFGVAAYGTLLVRPDFELRESDLPVPGLPPDLEGLRVALLSDIHFGPYLSLPELERVIDMANETRPHLTLVTGDLITRRGDSLEHCMARLARLRSDAGVFGCLGNHEIYADCEDFTASLGRTLGIEFLRKQARILKFGGARLNLAGVDYQRQQKPYLVGAGGLIVPGAVNVLLSHNPDVFPVAADLGYDLIVGGHTHGGQVTVEILEQTLNIGRFFTPFVAGLYRRGSSSLYVSRGIGTITLPMRLGVRPEVSFLKLRRA